MEYKTGPIALQVYEESKYSKEEAYQIIENAKEEKTIIICKVTGYDQKSGKTLLEFYGNQGVVDRGHISLYTRMDIDYLIGKAIGVYVKEINQEENFFKASRLQVEEMAKKEIDTLQVGDIVEGIVGKIVSAKECAFVDIKEGFCAYLSLEKITYLPNTCCTIDEFIKSGDRIKGRIISIPNNYTSGKSIRISLILEDETFEKRCKEYVLNTKYEGTVRKDKVNTGVYYIKVDNVICIRFHTKREIGVGKPVEVILKEYNFEDKMIDAIIEEEIIPEPMEKIINGSMFHTKVKAVKSPFAVREGEDKIFETDRVKNGSMESILNKFNNGPLDDSHVNILKIVCKLGFCTTKQIMSYAYSQQINIKVKSRDKLANKIDSLKKIGLIEIIRFVSKDGNGIFRVYNISESGELFLKKYLREKKTLYFSDMPTLYTYRIKRMLAVNQYALACMEKVSSSIKIYCQENIFIRGNEKLKPNAILEYSDYVFFIEGIRRIVDLKADEKDKEEKEISYKIERYQILLNNFYKIKYMEKNPTFIKEKQPFIIFVCEDYEHAVEMSKKIENSIFSNTIFFTHDLQIFQCDFEFSLYRINNKTSKATYYSVLDLFERGQECCTEQLVNGKNISNHEFNSFPEEWLRQMIKLGNELDLKEIVTKDPNQNLEYLYRKDYKNFLKSAQLSREKTNSEVLWEPRLFFFGSGGSGKTSLINLLAGKNFNPNEKKTDGVRVLTDLLVNIPWMQNKEGKIDYIRVWDFAGQECDHALTSCLITDAALCVIVVDSRREDYPDEWLDYIQIYAPRAKVLLVLNKIDSVNIVVKEEEKEKYSRLDLAYYLKKYPSIVGIYHISCLTPNMSGCELEKFQKDICSWIWSMRNQFENVWVKGIKELRNWMKDYSYGYITMREFKQKHKELGLQEKVDPEATLKLCVQAGICIYHKSMGNYIILKPQWVTCALSKLLRNSSFSQNKWQLSKQEICNIIDEREEDASYIYEAGESDDLIQLMNGMEICVLNEDNYFFPCFLPYVLKGRSVGELLDVGNWYETEIRYKRLLPDIFTKLQVKLWNKQWNNLYEYEVDYEPDKSRIIFVQNGRKMMAYKDRNSIILALERRHGEESDIQSDGRQALKEVRLMLKDINNMHNLEEQKNQYMNDKIEEHVILKGRSNDSNMERVRFSYSKNNLKKMCIMGVKEQYFPEVDNWYNVSELLLEDYTEKTIKSIYQNCIVTIYSVDENDETLEGNELQFEGMGFLVIYRKKWYVICCAHEIMENRVFYVELYKGKRIAIKLLEKCYGDSEDIAILEISEEDYKYADMFPQEMLSLKTRIEKEDTIYCVDCTRREGTIELRKIYLEKINGKKNFLKKREGGGIICGMSGTPILNLNRKCLVGMVRNGNENLVGFIDMDSIWKFIEKTVY